MLNHAVLVHFVAELLWIVLLLSLPTVLAASIIGIIVSLFQTLTQLQDQTVSFLIKLIVVCVTLYLSRFWMGDVVLAYAQRSFLQISSLRAP